MKSYPNCLGTTNGIKRFSASSYGSFPHETLSDWQSAIEQLDASGTLDPLPINQEYDLILNLLSTPAVKAIKHSNGNAINFTRVLQTVTDGYENYCYLIDNKNPCERFGCANSVRIGDMVFNHASIDEHYHVIFEEWTTSPTKNQLFFENNHWYISEGHWNIENPKVKSADCPMNGTKFVDPSIVFQQSTSDWSTCSIRCSNKEHCNYWEFQSNDKLCIMIESFESMAESSEETYIGTRDCPGSKELRNSMFGSCVENHPSMWAPQGESYFAKDVYVEKNDPNVLVVGGGIKFEELGIENKLVSVETIGDYDCSWPIPNLPSIDYQHSMAITPEGSVLSCGGDTAQECIAYEKNLKTWSPHSTLKIKRTGASTVTLPEGVYILGGFDASASFTSEILPKGSKDWIEGPAIPVKTMQSCAVGVSNTQFVIIGGGYNSFLHWEAYSHSR